MQVCGTVFAQLIGSSKKSVVINPYNLFRVAHLQTDISFIISPTHSHYCLHCLKELQLAFRMLMIEMQYHMIISHMAETKHSDNAGVLE